MIPKVETKTVLSPSLTQYDTEGFNVVHQNANVNSGEYVDRAAKAVMDRALEAQAQDCPWTAHTLVRCGKIWFDVKLNCFCLWSFVPH